MRELRYDDSDDALGHDAAVTQGFTDGIGIKIMLTGILLNLPPPLFTDTGRVLQGP